MVMLLEFNNFSPHHLVVFFFFFGKRKRTYTSNSCYIDDVVRASLITRVMLHTHRCRFFLHTRQRVHTQPLFNMFSQLLTDILIDSYNYLLLTFTHT